MRKFLIHVAVVSIALLFSAQNVIASPTIGPYEALVGMTLFLAQFFAPFIVLFIGLFLLYKNLKSRPVNQLRLLLALVLAIVGLLGSITSVWFF